MTRIGTYERRILDLLDSQEIPATGRRASSRQDEIARFEAQYNGGRSPRWERRALAAESRRREVPAL